MIRTTQSDDACTIISDRADSCSPHQITCALADAGLLVTPLHERALRACEEFGNKEVMGDRDWFQRCVETIRQIRSESLAAKKPKERWSAVTYGAQLAARWYVSEEGTHSKNDFGPMTEPQARAVAAALSALEK
jgi:hypothetical protein